MHLLKKEPQNGLHTKMKNSYENIQLSLEESVAKIYLDRPDKLNAYTPDMGDEIIDAFRKADSDDSIKVIGFLGNGQSFCAGADREFLTGNKLSKSGLKIGEDEFYDSYYIYLTGHGNISFSDKEAQKLRRFLLEGGFMHADDNYGMDISFRREMKKVFPDKEWIELPNTHSVFNIYYQFDNGLPKIHEHDNKRPQALALFDDEKIIAIYTYESDLGDGWEDQTIHGNPEEIRQQALKMGANIVLYSLTR